MLLLLLLLLFSQVKSNTRPMIIQTEDTFQLMDEITFEKSSAGLRTSMRSAQSTFQDSVESLRDILTGAMQQDLKTNIDRAMDHIGQKQTALPSPTPESDRDVKYTQTCPYVGRVNSCWSKACEIITC